MSDGAVQAQTLGSYDIERPTAWKQARPKYSKAIIKMENSPATSIESGTTTYLIHDTGSNEMASRMH